MELSPELVFVIGLVASVVVWLLRLLAKNGKSIPDAVLTVGVYVVSGVLALLFATPSLPAFPPFVDMASFVPAFLVWIGDLLVPLSAFVGFAGLIYQSLLKRILEGAALKVTRFFNGE